MVRHAGAGSPALRRLRLASTLTVTGGQGVVRGMRALCATISTMAAQLDLGPEVCVPLRQF